MNRFFARLSDGAYGEWEVIDRETGKPLVPYAWLTQTEAQREAKRLNDGKFRDQDEAFKYGGMIV